MADETNEGFLAGLPFIGNFFKTKTEVIDAPVVSTPIPDEGSLNTTPMVVLPDEAPATPANTPSASTQSPPSSTGPQITIKSDSTTKY